MTNYPPPRVGRRATIAKGLPWRAIVPVLVFVSIFGGWFGLKHLRDITTPLPGAESTNRRCSLWAIGSSTIYRWSTLQHDLSPWQASNRGVFAALIPYLHRRMLAEPDGRRPGLLVFYGGDNDIAAGERGAEAASDAEALITDARRRFGPLPIYIFSVKPSPARWHLRVEQLRYNRDVRRFAAGDPMLHFVDIVPAMLRDGRPGPFYVEDGIHMNAAGYAVWTEALRRAIDATALPAALSDCDRDAAQSR